jgi:tryptophan synthase alpha chain
MRLHEVLKKDSRDLLSIYFTAGFPSMDSMPRILQALESAGTDFVEIGIPYSDPICDGPVIQSSSQKALNNGMTLELLFEQLSTVPTNLPIILMGYYNTVLQCGIERFCERCQAVGVEHVILPDLPLEIYNDRYRDIFMNHHVNLIFLVTPQTSVDRIRLIDENSSAFIYAVSSPGTTGSQNGIGAAESYLSRLKAMELKQPVMVGFNISNAIDFQFACEYANGGIIGSAFINRIKDSNDLARDTVDFIQDIKQKIKV